MNVIQKRVLALSEKVIFGILGFICTYLFLNSIFSTCLIWYDTLVTYYIKDFPVLLLGVIFVLAALTILLQQKLRKLLSRQKWIMGIATIVWLGLLLVFVFNTDIELVQDQGRIYAGLEDLVSGKTELWEQGGYFYDYPFQNGLVLLFSPLMLIFNEYTYEAVQIVNLLSFWLLAFGCFKLCKKNFGCSVALCSYVAILYFFPLWGYVKYFYGNLIGLSFIIWSIYWLTIYLEDYKLNGLLKCSACVLSAIICKSNFSIFVVAMMIVLVLEVIKKKQLKYCFAAILLLLCMVAGMKGPAFIVHLINGCETNNGIPMIHWVTMGLRESYLAPGWYSGNASEWYAENHYSAELATQSAWAEIKSACQLFAQEKDYALRFFSRKFASIWNNPTFESFAIILIGNLEGTLSYWMKDILYNGGVMNTLLTIFLDVLHSVYLFGVLLYIICCGEEREIKKSIPLIAFIGGVLFHCFWEAKGQYTFMYFVAMIPYSFVGYRGYVRKISEWWLLKDRKAALIQSKAVRKLAVLLVLIIIVGVWNHPFITSTVKLQGQEADYIWICKEYDYWKADGFTKDSTKQ